MKSLVVLLAAVLASGCASSEARVASPDLRARTVAFERDAGPSHDVTEALRQRGYSIVDGEAELEASITPEVRLDALRTAGGIEWDTSVDSDRVVRVTVRERSTGRIVDEAMVPR